jgi:hypothetical protein
VDRTLPPFAVLDDDLLELLHALSASATAEAATTAPANLRFTPPSPSRLV